MDLFHAPKTSGHVRITPGRLRTWGILVSLMIMALNYNRTLQAQHAEYNCMCLKLLDYFGRIQAVIYYNHPNNVEERAGEPFPLLGNTYIITYNGHGFMLQLSNHVYICYKSNTKRKICKVKSEQLELQTRAHCLQFQLLLEPENSI